jgi:hypothetical protein
VSGQNTASKKDKDDEDLRTLLRDLQHRQWMYKQNHGEIWSGVFDGPPSLPAPHLLADCQVTNNRIDIIEALPKGGTFAEIGTLHGDFIVKVIEISQPEAVHLFDLDFSNLRPENYERIQAYGKATFHLGDSSSQLSKLAESAKGAFDIIYIDADHSYEGVWKDLTAALPILKPRGYLVCNDYTTWDPIGCCPYGVFSAVNRFATEHEFYFTHLALESCGFHDVALQRKI